MSRLTLTAPNHEKPQNKKGSYFRNYLIQRAENGTQTRDPQLGRLVLYQLSYFRKTSTEWVVMDSNHRSRKTADLQSAPFGHSGICPTYFQRTTASQHLFLSLLSDSNQRPRDYKSRALAN